MASTTTSTVANPHEQQIEQLRTKHNLRPISSDEEGLALGKLPSRILGFTYAPATETPLFARKSYHSFEVHKLVDGSVFLLAFATTADAERVRSHKEDIDVTVYPDPYEQATALVRIPFDRILSNHYKPIRYDGNALHLKLGAF